MSATDTLRQRLHKLNQAVASKRITVEEWRLAVANELKGNPDGANAIDAIARQLSTQPVLDADNLDKQLEALLPKVQSDNALETVGQIALATGTLAFFANAFKKARGGTPVSIPTVSGEVFSKYADFYNGRFDKLAQSFADGTLTVEEWHLAMATEIADLHATAYAAGKGGFGNLDSQDFANINAKALEQQRYLNAWVAQLNASGELPSVNAIQARARLYGSAANASLQRGMTEAMGLPELPAYSGDGSTICRTNDKCSWRIVQLAGNGNWDAFWELHPAEHCETCIQRSIVWNPLRIRNGAIQPFPETGLYAA